MSDAIQERLELVLNGGDWRRLGDVITELTREAEPIVGRFLRLSGSDRHEAAADLVRRLLFPEKHPKDGRCSKLLWPGGKGSAVTHRRLVFGSRLVDDQRKERSRRDADEAAAKGLTPDQIRACRKSRKSRRETTGRSAPWYVAGAEATTIRRAAVARVLPLISQVARRVAVAVTYGFDPTVWAEELAEAQTESLRDVRERMDAVQRAEPQAELRLLYPSVAPEQSREAFRKLSENGIKDIRKQLDQQPELRAELAGALQLPDESGA